MAITRPGSDITQEGVLEAIEKGERVAHAISRYFGGDNPDPGVISSVYERLDELEVRGIIWRDQLGLYHKF